MDSDHLWLAELQERTFDRASHATSSSFPPENRMSGARLAAELSPGSYAVLATTRPAGRPHATPTSFVVHGHAVWLPTSAGAARLAHFAAHPWASLVVMRGDPGEHRMVTIEGPAEFAPEDGAAAAYGRDLSWAAVWVRLTPRKLFSYAPVAAPDGHPGRSEPA